MASMTEEMCESRYLDKCYLSKVRARPHLAQFDLNERSAYGWSHTRAPAAVYIDFRALFQARYLQMCVSKM